MDRHLLDRSNCIYGIFTDLGHVCDLGAHLVHFDLEGAQVRILEGEEGSRELDQDGRRHGLLARLRRLVQGMTDELAHLEEYAHALSRGRVVVAMHLPTHTHASDVGLAFKSCGARFVHHYSAWMTQKLCA